MVVWADYPPPQKKKNVYNNFLRNFLTINIWNGCELTCLWTLNVINLQKENFLKIWHDRGKSWRKVGTVTSKCFLCVFVMENTDIAYRITTKEWHIHARERLKAYEQRCYFCFSLIKRLWKIILQKNFDFIFRGKEWHITCESISSPN